LRESVLSVQADKVRACEDAAGVQSAWAVFEEHDLLHPPAPDRLDESPPFCELVRERQRHARERSRDENGFEWRLLG
jgi:hypothetical protein